MSSALEAYGQQSKAQHDWFRDNIDLLLPAVAVKRSARLKVTVRNSRSAHRELQAAKRTVQCLTRFAVSRYWENLSTRIQQCADCGDLHGLYSGIREAIGPIPKKLSPLHAADGALLVDTSAQLERWVDHYTSSRTLYKHAPLKMMSRKQQRMHRKPWISKGILKSIKTKNKLFSKIQNLVKTDSNKWNKYKKYRNKLNHIIEYAKMTYFKNQIAQKGNNSRKLWSTINEILNKGKKQTTVIIKVQNELGSSDTTAFDIANTLSKYFSFIGEKLANQIEKTILVAPKTSPASNLQTSFFLLPTCSEKVQKEISTLDAKKAVSINDIQIKYLKLAGTTISKFLSDLLHVSLIVSTLMI